MAVGHALAPLLARQLRPRWRGEYNACRSHVTGCNYLDHPILRLSYVPRADVLVRVLPNCVCQMHWRSAAGTPM